MLVEKSPLRPGLSYPLRVSTLEAQVKAAGVVTDLVVHKRSETWWTEGGAFPG
jgi:hypothetical protein